MIFLRSNTPKIANAELIHYQPRILNLGKEISTNNKIQRSKSLLPIHTSNEPEDKSY